MELSIGDQVRVTSQEGAFATGRRVGDIGTVEMVRERSKRFYWVRFWDGSMAPFDAAEVALVDTLGRAA